MEGLAQYGDSDSDAEQSLHSAPLPAAAGEISKKFFDVTVHSHAMLRLRTCTLLVQGWPGKILQTTTLIPHNLRSKARPSRPLQPCPVQQLCSHKEAQAGGAP